MREESAQVAVAIAALTKPEHPSKVTASRCHADEWMRSVTGDRLVKFTYLELSDGGAFLTAQIGGHEVVYSVILDTAQDPFSREAVERHFERELRAMPN